MKKKITRGRLCEKEKNRPVNRTQDRFVRSGVVIRDVYNVLDPARADLGTSFTPYSLTK